ncbi:Prophage CP4-57 integrase [compost metagenome]
MNELGFSADWIERQLAHVEPIAVRRTYNQAAHLAVRAKMIQQWANMLDTWENGLSTVTPIKKWRYKYRHHVHLVAQTTETHPPQHTGYVYFETGRFAGQRLVTKNARSAKHLNHLLFGDQELIQQANVFDFASQIKDWSRA